MESFDQQATADNTLAALKWASSNADSCEMVKLFWDKLRDAVDEPKTKSAKKIISELSAYGGNTIVNIFRGGGVSYHEVVRDVAETLAPMFKKSPYGYASILNCETYILDRMGIKKEDIEAICAVISSRGTNEAIIHGAQVGTLEAVVAGSVVTGIVYAGGQAAIEKAISVIGGERLTDFVAVQIIKKTAAKAVQEAAKKTAQEAAKRAAQEAAKQIAIRLIAAANIFLGALTVVSIAGPATRKTIPATTYVALLRKMYEADLRGF